jgi:uncharacterized protein
MSAAAKPFLVSGRPAFTMDGQPSVRLGTDCFRLETIEDENGMASLEAVFLNLDHPDPGKPVDFIYFNRDIIDFGRTIEVAFNDGSAPKVVFTGIVTALGCEYPEAREPELMVHAEDRLAELRIRRRTRVFENRSDADILSDVANDAGLAPDVRMTGPGHTQHLQVNQSDLDLLRERAGAADGLMTLRDKDFRVIDRSRVSDTPVRMSNRNELIRFSVLADLAHQRTRVRVHGWDVANAQAIHEEAGADTARAAAEQSGRVGPEVLGGIWPEAAEDLHQEMPATADEARRLAQAHMARRSRGFVRGRGTALGNPALRVGSRVELVDLGAFFSGVYRLTAVRHRFDMNDGYRTWFEAERAALGAS